VVIPLDNNRNDLWQGGPWEQPAPRFEPHPAVLIPQPSRPTLRTRKRRRRRWPWLVGALVLILAAAIAASQFDPISIHFPPPGGDSSQQEEEYSTEPPSIPRSATGTGVTLEIQPVTGQPLSYTEIYAQCAPSMVSIEASGRKLHSTGTGIILTEDGYILTNAHVVAGAQQVDVVFYNNRSLPANLVGFDAREDLAVLKVGTIGLTPAPFGDSNALQCGDPVAAIGDPLGYRSTITDGIISALDREVDVDNTTMTLIQTSAAINFGNSGGALINQYGQVVGVTTIKIVSHDGSAESLGFAIPSQRVKYVVDSLIAGKEVRTGMFGITVNTIPAQTGGLEVLAVDEGSDAKAKGLLPGDVLLTVDGQTITGTQDLSRAKQSRGPGDTVTFTFRRGHDVHTVEIALIDSELPN